MSGIIDSNASNSNDENIVEVSASALPTGASTAANQTTTISQIGSLTETAPVTDIGSSGLNGRLQRIAQRLSTLISDLTSGLYKINIRGNTDGTSIGNAGDALKTSLYSTTGNAALITDSSPASSAYGMVVRQIPYELPTFSIVAENVQLGNNKSLIAIKNTGTGRLVLREVWIINDQTTAVTGVAGEFRLHRIGGFTGGTALTIAQLDSADTLPAGITAVTNGTVSGETSLLRTGKWSTDEWGTGTLDQEGLDHALQQSEPFWKQSIAGKGIVVRQNEGVHIRFATNSTAGFFNLRFIFTAEA